MPVAASADDQPTSVTVSEEHLVVSTRWEISGRLRLRRRVVTETRTIDVTVRREELTTEWEPAQPEAHPADDTWNPDHAPSPLVFLLREEVPEVTLRVRTYEQATATVSRHAGTVPVGGAVRIEKVAVEQSDSPLPPEASLVGPDPDRIQRVPRA